MPVRCFLLFILCIIILPNSFGGEVTFINETEHPIYEIYATSITEITGSELDLTGEYFLFPGDTLSIFLDNAFYHLNAVDNNGVLYMFTNFMVKEQNVWVITNDDISQGGEELPWLNTCTIINNMNDRSLVLLYISSPIEDGWGQDYLGDSLLEYGDTFSINLPTDTYNFRLTDDVRGNYSMYAVHIDRDSSFCIDSTFLDGYVSPITIETESVDSTFFFTSKYYGLGILVYPPAFFPLIEDIYTAKPAYEAGLRRGDIVLSINDTPCEDMIFDDFRNLISANRSQSIDIEVLRSGVKNVLEFSPIVGENGFIGITLGNRSLLVINKVYDDSPASSSGLPVGGIIYGINEQLFFDYDTSVFLAILSDAEEEVTLDILSGNLFQSYHLTKDSIRVTEEFPGLPRDSLPYTALQTHCVFFTEKDKFRDDLNGGTGSCFVLSRNVDFTYAYTNKHCLGFEQTWNSDALSKLELLDYLLEVGLDETGDTSGFVYVHDFWVHKTADLACLRFPTADFRTTGLHYIVPPLLPEQLWEDVTYGDITHAVGFPGALSANPRSFTSGTISNPELSISEIGDVRLVQTTAAINLGNSGGPLFVEINAENCFLLGINTWGLSGCQGMFYAQHISELSRDGWFGPYPADKYGVQQAMYDLYQVEITIVE